MCTCLYIKEGTDQIEAIKHIEKVLKEDKAVNLYLKDNSNLSTRQIAAILGVNRNIVQKARMSQGTVPRLTRLKNSEMFAVPLIGFYETEK